MTRFGIIAIASLLAVGVTGCTNADWSRKQAPNQASKPSPQPTAPTIAADSDIHGEEPALAAVEPPVDADVELALQEYLADLDTARQPEPAPVRPRSTSQPVETPVKSDPVDVGKPQLRSNAAVTLPTNHGEDSTEPSGRPAPPRVTHVSLLSGDLTASDTSEESAPSVQQEMDLASRADASLAQLIVEAEADLLEDPINARKQWRLSLLRLAANQPHDAAALSPGISRESRALIARMVAVMDSAGRLLQDPVTGADETLAKVDTLRDALRENAELSIPTVAFCTKVTNFGIYDVMPAGMLQPYQANNVIVYWEVKNCRTTMEDDGRFHTSLSSRLELFTVDGRSIWIDEQSRIEDYSKQRREDFFLAQLVTLPADLGPGDYILKVTMTDRLASKINQATHTFTIDGADSALPSFGS